MKETTLSRSPVNSSGELSRSSLAAIGAFVIGGGPGGLGPGGGGGGLRGPSEDKIDWVAGWKVGWKGEKPRASTSGEFCSGVVGRVSKSKGLLDAERFRSCSSVG